jgi:hypothetical protein
VALVCRNGHVVNDRLRASPERNPEFCPICGAETVSACPGCREPLLGAYLPERAASAPTSPSVVRVPRFCASCGRPLPWTERTLSAARAMIRELSGLPPETRRRLRQSLEHVIQETPQTWEAIRVINETLAQLNPGEASTLRALIVSAAADKIRPHFFPEDTAE